MPILSMFYGIVVRMYFFDDKQHHVPHLHPPSTPAGRSPHRHWKPNKAMHPTRNKTRAGDGRAFGQ